MAPPYAIAGATGHLQRQRRRTASCRYLVRPSLRAVARLRGIRARIGRLRRGVPGLHARGILRCCRRLLLRLLLRSLLARALSSWDLLACSLRDPPTI